MFPVQHACALMSWHVGFDQPASALALGQVCASTAKGAPICLKAQPSARFDWDLDAQTSLHAFVLCAL